METLRNIYNKVKQPEEFKKATKSRIIKIILGASVVRAFKSGTKDNLVKCLSKININSLALIQSKEEYDRWHFAKITSVYNCLLTKNRSKFKKDLVGLKWGHATKVFNLFIGHLYFFSPYFDKQKRKMKVRDFLHVPLDSKVFKVLKSCDIEVPKGIKYIDSTKYRKIQEFLREAADLEKVPPLRFDDYAWAQMD